jgi:hypothetical protein
MPDARHGAIIGELCDDVGAFTRMAADWWSERELGRLAQTGGRTLAVALHHANFLEWRAEDQSRRRDLSDHVLMSWKRRVEDLNQRRHGLIEEVDELLWRALEMDESSELHSETPGMIVDRLSVLAIRLGRLRGPSPVLASRPGDPSADVARQFEALRAALEGLLAACRDGQRHFMLQRQYKIFADPDERSGCPPPGRDIGSRG